MYAVTDEIAVNLDDGWVAVREGFHLTGQVYRDLNDYLGGYGYELSDPLEIEPVHVEEGLRFYVESIDGSVL